MQTKDQLRKTPVSEIMTTDIIVLKPNTQMHKVAQLFENRSIHHLPVIDETDKMVGIITRSDYLRLLHTMSLFKNPEADEYNEKLLKTMLAKEVMGTNVQCLRSHQTLEEVVALLRQNRFHAVPIIDENGTLVGIVTTYDLIMYAYDS